MQVNFALDKDLRDDKYPFTRLKGLDVNTLVFPNLTAANASYKMIKQMSEAGEVVGPIQMGLNKPASSYGTDYNPPRGRKRNAAFQP